MHHLHMDMFARMDTPVHRLDARVKLTTALAFVFLVVLTPDARYLSFAVYITIMGAVILTARIPALFVLKRSLMLLPFAVAASIFVPFTTPGESMADLSAGPLKLVLTVEGGHRFASICLRAFTAFLAVITLVAATRFGSLMRAAAALGCPRQLVTVLSFMYRYLFILVDEAAHMLLARDLRAHGNRGFALVRASGGIVGALMVRSFEHSQQLYNAMLLRGYSGTPVLLEPFVLKRRDIISAALFLAAAGCGHLMGAL